MGTAIPPRTRPHRLAGMACAIALWMLVPSGGQCQNTPPPAPPTTTLPPGPPGSTGPDGAPGGDAAATAVPTDRVQLTADQARMNEEGTFAEGHVALRCGDVEVTAGSAFLDAEQVNVTFAGEVVVGVPHLKTTTTGLRINLETGRWRADQARAEVGPGYFDSGVVAPVYVEAHNLRSESEIGPLEAEAASITTCDRAEPHFGVRSQNVRVVPGRKVVLSNPSLYLFGHRVLRFPWDVTIPLDRRSQVTPEVGRNQIDGYYLKVGVPYTLDAANSGVARVSVTELRGVGFGVDHDLASGPHVARLSAFYEASEGALTGHLTHRWEMSDELDWELRSDYQRNSGYSGSSDTLTADWTLRRDGTGADSTLDMQRSLSTTSGITSARTAASFTHQQRLGADTTVDVRSSYSGYDYGRGQEPTEQLDATVEYRQRMRAADLRVVATDRYALSGSGSSGALARLPEATLTTDARRAGMGGTLERLGLRLTGEAGRYEDGDQGPRVGRACLRMDLGGQEYRFGERTRLQMGARFHQALYDEGSAKYVLGASTSLTHQLGGGLNLRLQYQDSRPSGYAPVSLDSWGAQRDLTVQLAQQRGDKLRVDVGTGFDFINDRWRTATGKLELMTSEWSKLSLQGSYDLQQAKWRPLDARWVWVRPERAKLTLSSVYDLDGSQLQQAGANLDWTLDRRTRLVMATRYSGYTKRVDQLDMQLTRDLHCWQAGVSYSKLTGDFQVSLGLKALPGMQAVLGSGMGYSSGAGAGSYY